MMYICLYGVSFFVLVNTHPLNIPFQPTNYHHSYQPQNEAYFVQPSNINLYSQPLTVQSPIACQQTPSLTEQITQLFLDKLLSDPAVRKILDSNKNVHDHYGTDEQTNLHPYNGGVVNNYIILPPDYSKINETLKQPDIKKARNESRRAEKENVALNDKKKKLKKDNTDNAKDVKSAKTSEKVIAKNKSQNEWQTWSFNTENIKCFTPIDVLKNEKYQPEQKINKKKQTTQQCHKDIKNQKSSNKCVNKSQKVKKARTNNVEDNSVKSSTRECRKKKEKPKNSSTVNKNRKHCKKVSNTCKCTKENEVFDKTKIVENVPQFCNQNIEDLLLSAIFQQDCTNLDNRCTRNSKADTSKKDLRNIYPDIPGDINNFNWYFNDLYSPQSLQQAFNSNAFLGNKYPFDFSQIYQIPQYSSADVSKSKGNTDKNKTTRRKKKKKKSSKNKTRKEASIDDDNNTQVSDTDKNKKVVDASKNVPEINIGTSTPSPNTKMEVSETLSRIPEVSINTLKESSPTNPETSVKETSKNNVNKPTELAEKITTESTPTTAVTSIDKEVKEFKDSTEHLNDIPEYEIFETFNENLESKEESKELFETQIPHSILQKKNENNRVAQDIEEDETVDEMLPILGFDVFNQHPGFGSEDNIFNVFMNDYYPDFRADNHAYLTSDEEIDIRNNHDRYFYVTDKNIDSREMYSSQSVNEISRGFNDVKLQDLNISGNNANTNRVKEKDNPQEVVFRTPPGLETPDFITRKINREAKDTNEVYYQHDWDDFDRFNLDSFDDTSSNSIQTARNDNTGRIVETVYAKSKVVKYGQGHEVNDFKGDPKKVFSSDGIENDGKTMVVVAKSLRPGEFW